MKIQNPNMQFYVFPFALSFLLISLFSNAQDSASAPATKQEVWPEINLYYRLNDKLRLFTSLSATKLKTSSYTDGGLSVNLDYFAFPILRKMNKPADSASGHLLVLRAGFYYATTPAKVDDQINEYTINTEASLRFYLPYHMLLTNRNRIDWRFINGDFQPRYRPRLKLERDFKTAFLQIKLYTYAEYFLYFYSTKHNRLRLSMGSELKVSEHINFEFYFVHQFDNGLSAPSVNAVGLSLITYLRKGDHLFSRRFP